MRKSTIQFLLSLFAPVFLAAQMQITPSNTLPFTPENLISNVFLGQGVEVKKITFGGDPLAAGYFSTAQSVIGIERGIILSSGRVESGGGAFGANEVGNIFASSNINSNVTDPDLAAATTNPILDVTIYTIEFVPIADTLRFNYVFASEEYPEYACSAFNDVFGFFISGPKPGGGNYDAENIAKVPATGETVTINNVHMAWPPNNCPAKNANIFNNNNGSNVEPTYDGVLDVLTAEAVVIPCQVYTIKIAIADAGDEAFDSAVFLEAKSFGTGSLDVEFASVSLDGAIAEGCSPGVVKFSLPYATKEDYPIDYNIFGTAINGLDYQNIPNGLFIAAGDSVLTIPIIALADNLVENGEFLAIDVRRDICNRDTFFIYFRDNNLVPPNLPTDTTICLGNSVTLDGTLPVPLPTPPSFSNPMDFSINPINTALFSPINVFGVQPTQLGPGVIRSVCVDISHTWIDDMDLFLLAPNGFFVELTTDNGKNSNDMQACFLPTANTPPQSLNDSLKIWYPPGGNVPGTVTAPLFIGDWAAEGFWSDLWDGPSPTNGTWKLLMRDDQQGFIGTLNEWEITFEPAYKINYAWTPAANLSCADCPITTITPTESTLYHLKATDSYGCLVEDSTQINVLLQLDAPTVFCQDQNASSINFVWTDVFGATDGYEVNIGGTGWVPANGNLEHLVSGLAPNASVTIEVRGKGGCTAAIGTTTCQNCEVPTVNFSTIPTSCFGIADGSATLLANGTNPPFDFKIGGFTNQTGQFNGLAGGIYIATITDATGCAANLPVEITEPDELLVEISILENAKCAGSSDGSASATATGGTAPISFLWNDANAQTAPVSVNLAAGNITVVATDGAGCTATNSAQVLEPQAITATLTSSPADCFGTATGSATAGQSGGTGPFTFLWDDPNAQKTATALNLFAGNFTVTITDANGCTASESIVVGQPTQLTATVATAQTSCNGGSDGTAIVSPTGGNFPYQYKWSGLAAQADSTATGLKAILYKITVTDAGGCSIVVDANVGEPLPFLLGISFDPLKCFGDLNGQMTANTNNGNGGETYKWSTVPAQTTQTAINLGAGNYTVTVTDSKGCTVSGSANMTGPTAISATATPENTSCFGGNDGKISVAPTGGTPAYSFDWSGGETTQNIDNQPVGNYEVTITDANGCTFLLENLTIDEPTEILATLVPTDAKCFGSSDGKVISTVTGGTGIFQFVWKNAAGQTVSTVPNPANFPTGNFDVTITDEKGCSVTISTTVGQPAAALGANLPTDAGTICFGDSTGFVTSKPTGGTSPYQFLWSNFTTSDTAFNLPAGPVFLTITDANGCSTVGTTQISAKELVSTEIDVNQPLCQNAANGSASITSVLYGNLPAQISDFLIKWSNGQQGANASNLVAGQNYSVTLTDADGCAAELDFALQNPGPMSAQIDSFSNTRCFGEATGWASANGVGGTAPFSFNWGQNAGNQQVMRAENLPAGTFSVTVTDANGCTNTASVDIEQPERVDIDFEKIDVKCHGEWTGIAEAKPVGGVAPFTFNWSNTGTTARVEYLSAGNFTCTLTDRNGCTAIDFVNIKQPASKLEVDGFGTGIKCFGERNGRINISATGGTVPYSYGLDGQNWNGSPIQIGLVAGFYTGRVRDANGCLAEKPGIEVKDRGQLELELGTDQTIVLGQSTQLNLQITGATPPVEIIWQPQDSLWLSCMDCPNPTVDSLFYEHTFRVLVIDSSGCAAEDLITIFVEKPRRVFVPTGFSPNGDDANQLLLVHGQPGVKIIRFRVYDRWGEAIWEAQKFDINDPIVGWDGTFRGKECDPGVYIWTLEVEYIDFVKEFFKGQTVLIR